MSLHDEKIDEEHRSTIENSVETTDNQHDYCYMDDTGTLNIQSFGSHFQVQVTVTKLPNTNSGQTSEGIVARPTASDSGEQSEDMRRRSSFEEGGAGSSSRSQKSDLSRMMNESPYKGLQIFPENIVRPKRQSSRGNYQGNGCTASDRNTSLSKNSSDITSEQATTYLLENPDFLERHIMKEVELEQLERWMIRRTQQAKKSQTVGKNGRKTSLSRWKFCVHADKRKMLLDLTQSLQQHPTKSHVLWELSNCISSAVGADSFRLYLAENGNPDALNLYIGNDLMENGEPKMEKVKCSAYSVPTYVARTRESIRLSKGENDPRFPDGIQETGDIAHILCQPIAQPDGTLVAVLEILRREDEEAFHEEDEEIAFSYLVWGGIALHYAHLFLNMSKQRKLNEFLLVVVKSIFQDMVSMDMLVIKIMNFAQRLVRADRASLFLLDHKNKELYATIFDIGNDNDKKDEEKEKEKENQKVNEKNKDKQEKKVLEENNQLLQPKEIRFPVGTGIAGQVALTGEVLNIKDAYADPRFNREVDSMTGYKTDTILCMPIYIRGMIIGVVQMVNKRVGYFTYEDEEAFQMFAVYCGLALHHAKLYDKIRRSAQKYRVALEVLSYHNTCNQEEVNKFLAQGIPDSIPDIDDYYFNPFAYDDFEKARHTIYMFIDLFGLHRFDQNSLIKFTLTVKKNYRRVPYHNWTHGFSVANTMYTVIKKSGDAFRAIERLALFIGSLCHDLDHRGKNNKFMLDTESPLAAIYSTSTMEHHHFNQTVTILQQEGHNIFGKLNSTEYKQVLGLIKHCILATDLAIFFPNKAKLGILLETKHFDPNNVEHRMLMQAISMTASDLSASTKPWEIQVQTVKVIFEEFYQQGDAERSAGRIPIPMMDRYQPDQQAASQVGFLTGICLPCYNLLYQLIPETKPLLEMCEQNLGKWQDIANKMQKKREERQIEAGNSGEAK